MTFKIVVLSLMLGIWGLDARSQNEEPDFSGQSEDSLMQALGNIPAFTIYKDNYVVTGTSFTGGKISKYNSDAKFQISLRHRLYRKLLPYRIYLFLTYSQKSFWDIYRKSAPFADNNYNPSLGFGRNFIGEGRIKGIGMVQFEHESNGRDSIWSRSWNRLTFTGIYLMNKNYTFQAKVWIAMQVAKENRHLTRYAGIGHLAGTYASDNGRLSIRSFAALNEPGVGAITSSPGRQSAGRATPYLSMVCKPISTRFSSSKFRPRASG